MTAPQASPASEPGDVRGPGSPASVAGRRGDRSVVYGLAAAVVSAAVLFVLAGPLSVDTGLLVVGAAGGWAVGFAVRTGAAGARVPASVSRRLATAVVLALAACAIAWAGTWAWSHVQGGVLGPIDFLTQVYGLLVPAQLAFVAAGAALGSR